MKLLKNWATDTQHKRQTQVSPTQQPLLSLTPRAPQNRRTCAAKMKSRCSFAVVSPSPPFASRDTLMNREPNPSPHTHTQLISSLLRLTIRCLGFCGRCVSLSATVHGRAGHRRHHRAIIATVKTMVKTSVAACIAFYRAMIRSKNERKRGSKLTYPLMVLELKDILVPNQVLLCIRQRKEEEEEEDGNH